MCLGKLGQKADDKTADHIDGQCAIGKAHALRNLLNVSACKITQDRADKTAEADEEKIGQLISFVPMFICVYLWPDFPPPILSIPFLW